MVVVDINLDHSENVKYDYSDYPIYVRRGLLSLYPNFSADSHWHDDIELILVLSGKMRYNVNGDIVTLHAGEGIVVNTRQLHFGFSDEKAECDFICILFHPMLLCAAKSFESKYVAPMLRDGAAYIHLSPTVQWQNRILKHIRDIYDCKNEYEAPLFAQGYICSLWSHLIAHTDTKAKLKEASDTKLSTLKAMIDFIHRHYFERITLDDVAGAGNVSKRTCGYIFAQYLNKTPMEFLIDYRLRKAVGLLKQTDKTMLEISLAVGFSGASYFAEAFRKSFGISPSEFRKQRKNNIPDEVVEARNIGKRSAFLKTARVAFSKWENADFALAESLWGDPEVTKLICASGVFTAEEIAGRLKTEIRNGKKYGVQYWPIFTTDTNELIGCCGLRPRKEKEYEIGFHLRPPFWGQGYAKEAAEAVIRYAFTILKAEKLFAGHNPKNIASGKVLTKLGFTYIGDEYYEPTGLYHPSYELKKEK